MPSLLRTRPFATRILLVLSLAAAGTLALWACGPYFPNWLLGDEASVLDAPALLFRQELARWYRTELESLPPEDGDPFAQTAAADVADLRKALQASGMPAAPSRELVAEYSRVRNRLREHAASAGTFREEGPVLPSTEQGAEPQPMAPLAADVRVPAGLPAELADYLEGAIAYHQGRLDQARAAWERLLKRPEEQRRWRSTWAAFMLGKSHLRGDRREAVRWFERTRELAGRKLEDSLGLAAASLGWQARAELGLGRYDKALVLYAQQAESGDPLALSSLQLACRRALAASSDALVQVARSPDSRRVLTAFLASEHESPWGSQFGAWQREARTAEQPDRNVARWLAAVKSAGVKDASGAERLAWVAYQGADFASAREWLRLAPENAPLADWIRAKLLLRDGRLDQAEELLASASRRLHQPKLTEREEDHYRPWGTGGRIATGPLAAGERGVVLTTLGRYPQALHAFLRGGFWLDAAYLAERVLTLDELKEYVDESWPPGQTGNESPDWFEGVTHPDSFGIAHDIRYLLGRRLARAGRLQEAGAYLPGQQHLRMASLDKDLREGRDRMRPAADRARSLFDAACITRHEGLELLGTEIDPDWRIYEGQYEMNGFPMPFERRRKNKHLVPGPDEEEREERHRPDPFVRFHYRYEAADLAWEAARLLPDGSPEKAEVLATAGTWIKKRTPEAADRFYRELVRCCRDTDLGQEAAERQWIPDTETCPRGDVSSTHDGQPAEGL